jgi:tetratricopeptide (TPR) repeat protein
MSTNSTWQPPAWLNKARPRSRLSQLWQVPIFFLGLAALVGVCGGAVVRQSRHYQDFQQRMNLVRQSLMNKGSDLARVLPVAESLVEQASYYADEAGEAHLLLGSVLLRLAEAGPPERAMSLRRQALHHLEQAETIGVRTNERPQLWYRLGRTLYLTEGDLQVAIDYLTRALPRGADNEAEGFGLLAEAHLKLTSPDLDAALQANEQQINATNDETLLQPARLQRAELFVRKKQFEEALKVLDRIGSTAPKVIRQKALYLQAVACEAERLWSKAAPLWQQLLETPELVPGGKQHILYTLGTCYHYSHPPVNDKAIQVWELAQSGSGQEAQAAAVRLAELYLSESPPQFDMVGQWLQKALTAVQTEKDFNNSLVNIADVRELVEAAIHLAHDSDAHEQAQQFTVLYEKLSPPGSANCKLAEISESWAKALEARAEQADIDQAAMFRTQARTQWARAAEAYQKAAQIKGADQQAELLWHSVQCFRSAGEPARAIELLKSLLSLALAPDDQAHAWFILGEMCQASGRQGEAENAFTKCWEFDASSYSYRARYQLALMKIGTKNFDAAEKILWVNLKVKDQNLDREAHEKSLYLLASLLHQRGNYAQAYLWLQEAARRYPDNPEVFVIRDLLGDCYLALAREAQKKIDSQESGLPQTALSQLKQSRRDWLDKCRLTYDDLADDLRALDETKPLTAKQEKLYRKSALTVADAEFGLENYPEALRRYEAFAQKYRGQVEELIACQRIWMCCTALKYQQAKELPVALTLMSATLKSVRGHFAELPEDYFQEGAGTWPRKRWQEFFTEVESGLKQFSAEASK